MNVYRFKHYDCELQWSKYMAGSQPVALRLVAADTGHNNAYDVMAGEPIATATVYIEGVELGGRITAIKDWSENEGMLDFLVDNSIVVDLGKQVIVSNYGAIAHVVAIHPRIDLEKV